MRCQRRIGERLKRGAVCVERRKGEATLEGMDKGAVTLRRVTLHEH